MDHGYTVNEDSAEETPLGGTLPILNPTHSSTHHSHCFPMPAYHLMLTALLQGSQIL